MNQDIRIRAGAIRRRLLVRNSNETFRTILGNMTDAELCEAEDRHHAETLAWMNRPAETLEQVTQ